MSTNLFPHHVLVEAPREQLIGTTSIVDGTPVAFVHSGLGVIKYKHYTADYRQRSRRPWKLGRVGFAHLENALRAHMAKLPAPDYAPANG